MLAEQGIDDRLVLALDDRPTTLKERYIGRAQDRHPQQMIRVDYETRDPIPAVVEARLHGELAAVLEWAEVVLISDYGKGVCTPTLLRALIDAARAAGVKVLADPIRSSDYARYRGVHCMTPNRLEAQLATGMTIARAEDALRVGERLVETLEMEAVLVTLDRDGMALVRADGRAELLPDPSAPGLRHHRRRRHGARGRRPLPGQRRRLRRGRRAGQRRRRARGREVRRRAPDPRGDPPRPDRPPSSREPQDPGPGPPDRRSPPPPPRPARRSSSPTAASTSCTWATSGCSQQAAALGDFLVVGMNSDASVRRLKGPSRPLNPAEARAEVLSALEAVDAVTIFDEDTPLELITAIRPDVLVKGGDYRPDQVVGRAEVEAAGGRLVLVPPVPGPFDHEPGQPRIRARAHTSPRRAGPRSAPDAGGPGIAEGPQIFVPN